MNDKNTVGYWKSIRLEFLTKDEHEMLMSSGMMHVIYPESTGIYSEDCMSDWDKGEERMNNISSNGNDGEGYDATEEFSTNYRVPMSDNPDGVDFSDVNTWPHVKSNIKDKIFNDGKWNYVDGDSYAEKIERLYGVKPDGMFVDDYEPINPYHSDPVSPNHYEIGNLGVEAIDIIEASLTKEEFIGYCRGNLLKYHIRANKKNGDEDLRKADAYSGWLIAVLEES